MKVGMISLGCPKNQVSAEQMLYLLREAGHEIVTEEEEAEAIVVNTCAFIEDAKQEAINTILEVARHKEEGSLKLLIVTGCLAQLFKEQVLTELPEVDAVVGVGSCDEICEVLNRAEAGEKPVVIGDNSAPVSECGRLISTGPAWAYLLIAEGCDNRCSYCLIPSIRGRFRSRAPEDILAEADKLASWGYREIILVAQDLTRYGQDIPGWDLARLLTELVKIDGIDWIRLHYLYPHELNDGLIDVIANEPKIVKYLDIPLQHINADILKKMNRRDTPDEIRALLKKLRERIPGLVLRTSLITGLPGEGEAEFEELCQFLWDQRMLRAGVFPYSPEEGTPAAKMERVDTEEAIRRAELVVDIQSRIMDEWNEEVQGEVLEVLCEGFDGQSMSYVGRSYADSPEVDGHIYFTAEEPVEAGTFVRVRITGTMDGDLTGELVEEA